MIIKPAFFEICPLCNKHARITLPDRGNSAEFPSKDEGVEILSEGLQKQMFTSYELGELLHELLNSALPKGIESVEPKLLWRINQYNLLRDEKKHYEINVCEFIHEENSTEPVPQNFLQDISSKNGIIITDNQYPM